MSVAFWWCFDFGGVHFLSGGSATMQALIKLVIFPA